MRSLLFLISPQLVCKYFPPAQATDFMSTIVESLLCTRPVWRWTLTFLGECGEHIFQEEARQAFFPFAFGCSLLLAVGPKEGQGKGTLSHSFSPSSFQVPEIVTILYTCVRSTQQSTSRCFVLQAMFLLARSHQ